MQRKKKVDYQALMSPFARIPGIKPAVARALLDLGMRTLADLNGRAPESLYSTLLSLPGYSEAGRDYLFAFRLAVYFAETQDPDPRLLQVWHWQD
ncbi:MAG: pathogenicity locus [Verrucomicrobia bacterium]|nr:pathogenicity locus [Verrucomicrobiota bacterium]